MQRVYGPLADAVARGRYDEYLSRCKKHAGTSFKSLKRRTEEEEHRLVAAKVASERQRCRNLEKDEKIKDLQRKNLELKLQMKLGRQSKRGADRAMVIIIIFPPRVHSHISFTVFRYRRRCTPCVNEKGSLCVNSVRTSQTPKRTLKRINRLCTFFTLIF
jgi:hypothetical protein